MRTDRRTGTCRPSLSAPAGSCLAAPGGCGFRTWGTLRPVEALAAAAQPGSNGSVFVLIDHMDGRITLAHGCPFCSVGGLVGGPADQARNATRMQLRCRGSCPSWPALAPCRAFTASITVSIARLQQRMIGLRSAAQLGVRRSFGMVLWIDGHSGRAYPARHYGCVCQIAGPLGVGGGLASPRGE